MTQLFVCHTQYNLILATGLSSANDELILFKDFNLTDEMKKRLEGHFNRCLFLDGNYPKRELSAKEKLIKITADNHQLKAFIGIYDRIFIVDDMCIQEMYALKRAYKKNSSVEMAWLEDGAIAYFSNGVISRGMGSTSLKRIIRKLFFSVRFSLFGFYDLASCMGGHKRLTSAYVVFPDSIRPELRSKKLIAITDEEFLHGMKFMYAGEPFIMQEPCVLIAMDLLSVYGEVIDKVNSTIESIVINAKAEGKKVYCKYHPRETEMLPALANIGKLNSRIGIESYLINTTAQQMTVVGFKSTALQIARKLNNEVVSLVRLIDKDCGSITAFYTSIGIKCL